MRAAFSMFGEVFIDRVEDLFGPPGLRIRAPCLERPRLQFCGRSPLVTDLRIFLDDALYSRADRL